MVDQGQERRIVVGVKDADEAEVALRWAMAEGRVRGASVHATMATGMPVSYYPLGFPTTAVDATAIVDSYRKTLDALVGRVLGDPVGITCHTRMGAAAEVLLEEADGAELLVVGTRGLHGIVRWLGSVSDQVVRHATCPVAVIPGSTIEPGEGAPVVVGVDGSPNSHAAVEWALEEARYRGVPLRAVHIWALFDQHHREPDEHFDPHYSDESARSFLAEQVEEAVGGTAAAEIELATECDLPAAGLLRAADAAQAPLLVVGARGVGGFKGLLLGSVSHKVLVTTTRPVVVIHPSAS